MKKIILFLFLLAVTNLLNGQKNSFAAGINFPPLIAKTIEVSSEYFLTSKISIGLSTGYTFNSGLSFDFSREKEVLSQNVNGFFLKPAIKYRDFILPAGKRKDNLKFFSGLSFAISSFKSTAVKRDYLSSMSPAPLDTLTLKKSILSPGIELGLIAMPKKKYLWKLVHRAIILEIPKKNFPETKFIIFRG